MVPKASCSFDLDKRRIQKTYYFLRIHQKSYIFAADNISYNY